MVWRKCERHDEDGSLEENEERAGKEMSMRKCQRPRKEFTF